MDFRRQRYFLAVAQQLGFRRAADVLRVSQPALSQQIQSLEEDLGVSLFERTGREIRLTSAGQEYYDGVSAVMNEMHRVAQRARDAEAGKRGILSIGVNPMLLLSHFPPIIRRFQAEYPDVQLNVEAMVPPDALFRLQERKVDLAFTGFATSDQDIAAELLWRFPLKAVLPVDHPAGAGGELDLAVLDKAKLLIPGRRFAMTTYSIVRDLCSRHGLDPHEIREVPGELPQVTVLGLVASGLGIGFLSQAYENVKPASVVFKDLPESTPKLEVSACYRTGNTSRLVTAFMELARNAALGLQRGEE